MNNTASRPWLSFDLRTMFALLTFVCFATAWLSVEFSWIKQRRVAIANLETAGIGMRNNKYMVEPPAPAPGFLWLFGEQGGGNIMLYKDVISEKEITWLKSLFPEASFTPMYVKDGRYENDQGFERLHEEWLRQHPELR